MVTFLTHVTKISKNGQKQNCPQLKKLQKFLLWQKGLHASVRDSESDGERGREREKGREREGERKTALKKSSITILGSVWRHLSLTKHC